MSPIPLLRSFRVLRLRGLLSMEELGGDWCPRYTRARALLLTSEPASCSLLNIRAGCWAEEELTELSVVRVAVSGNRHQHEL